MARPGGRASPGPAAPLERRGIEDPEPVLVATLTASQQRATDLNVLARKQRSLWRDALTRLLRNKAAVGGMVIVAAFAVMALLAPVIAPYDPICYHYVGGQSGCGIDGARAGPTLRDPALFGAKDSDPRFVFGTDSVGRDVLSRLIWGARISMVVGLVPISIIILVGGFVGLLAAYNGGWVDNLLMRVVDILYAFPDLLLLIIIMATLRSTGLGQFGAGLFLIFIALSLVDWVGMARLVRGQALSVKEREFVEAARAIGVGPAGIMFKHIYPNCLAPVIVRSAFAIPGYIFAEAGLSFIGIGIIPPTPSWGVMINDGFPAFQGTPSLVLLPAACVALVLISFTFIGDGLRDALDPRMKI